MLKSLAAIAVAAVVLLVGALLALDWIAASAVEAGAEAATGLPTSVEGASLRPLAGRFGISGLEISNPSGFDSPRFFAMTDLEVVLPLAALMDDPIRIPSVSIDGVELTLERKGIATNASYILRSLADSSASQESSGPRLVIEELVIRNVRADLRLVPGGKPNAISIDIPEIRLRNVGGDAGAEIADVVRLIIGHTVRAVSSRRDLVPGDLRAELQRGFSVSASGTLGQALQQAGEEARGALERLFGDQ